MTISVTFHFIIKKTRLEKQAYIFCQTNENGGEDTLEYYTGDTTKPNIYSSSLSVSGWAGGGAPDC